MLNILTTEQVAAYRDQGFLHLPQVFTAAEIQAIRDEAVRLMNSETIADQRNLRCRWQNHFETNTPLLEAIDPVIDVSPVCKRMTEDHRLLDAMADLLGKPVVLTKDKLIFKQPGATGYNLHQDYVDWPGFPKSYMIALVSVDASDKVNGCLELWPGCHQMGYLSPRDGGYHELDEAVLSGRRRILHPLTPGDVLFFDGLLPHRSGPNKSAGVRRHLYLSYNAQDEGDVRADHYEQYFNWIRSYYEQQGIKGMTFR